MTSGGTRGRAERDAARAANNGQRRRGRAVPSALGLAAAAGLMTVGLVLAATRGPNAPPTLDERVQRIASGLRCVECQNLSVADSPAKAAGAMRAEIRDRLRAGSTPDEIQAYFVTRYGEWILLAPRASGLALVAWIAPAVALAAGAVALVWALRRKRRAGGDADVQATAVERARIRRDLATLEEPD